MTIKEAEKATGVSSRNIRFYEQKGLLTPVRNRENDYREYSNGDIERLKMIRALRMVDMPLEQIKGIVDGQIPMRSAVVQQKQELKQKIKKIETAVRFCDELERAGEQDVGEVLMRMDEPENRKVLFNKWKQDHSEIAKKLCSTFLGGAVFVFMGWIAGYFLLVLSNLTQMLFGEWEVPLVIAALMLIALWGYCGYQMYEKKWWWAKCLLIHIIPAVVVLLSRNALEGKLFLLAAFMFCPYVVLQEFFCSRSFFDWDWGTVAVSFGITFGVFCLGMLFGKISEIRRNAVKAKSVEEPIE